ncbi:hypothetical protein QAD02_001686 [Eretmocerus hayati]|uniref:Uncharacterized protein n=1 Tax=Eretmocerus hayati TaxID=131215 RepID=A0ACC2NH48_9HYME|nr:hypothetical protein QAD02_001686 [Eretmocerus hayati]
MTAWMIRFEGNVEIDSKQLSVSSTLRCLKGIADVSKALQVVEPDRKSADEFFKSEAQIQRSRDKKKLITTESEVNAVGIVSGVPEEHRKTRTVLIYMPSKSSMQSGTDNIHFWQISFDTRERWENPCMGWCSSGDPLQALRVDFVSKEEAMDHCKKMGWKYVVQNVPKNDPKPRTYGENFSWDKRTRVSTK